MKILILIISINLGICYISCSHQSISIQPAKELTEIDTLYNSENSLYIVRVDCFIISGDVTEDKIDSQIQSFVTSNSIAFSKKYYQYEVFFYKESKYANIDYIKQFPENLKYKVLQGEKPLVSYKWIGGNLIGKFKGF